MSKSTDPVFSIFQGWGTRHVRAFEVARNTPPTLVTLIRAAFDHAIASCASSSDFRRVLEIVIAASSPEHGRRDATARFSYSPLSEGDKSAIRDWVLRGKAEVPPGCDFQTKAEARPRFLDDSAFDILALSLVGTLDGLAVSHARAVLRRAEEFLLLTQTVDTRSTAFSEAKRALSPASGE